MVSEVTRNELTDREIWKKFKQGEITAFNLMFERYFGVLLNYGCKLSIDQQLVEDCIQEAFVEIWSKRERLGETDSIKFYMFKALKRKIFRRIKKESKALIYSELDHNYNFVHQRSTERDIIEGELKLQTNKKLNKAIGNLPNRQQEAIILRFYGQLSFREISGFMGIGMKSTYRVVSNAIEKLQTLVA